MKSAIYILAHILVFTMCHGKPEPDYSEFYKEKVSIQAGFTTNKDVYEMDDPVIITNTSTVENARIALYKWEYLGKVTNGIVPAPEDIIFETEGKYTFKLTVTADKDNHESSFEKTITVVENDIPPVPELHINVMSFNIRYSAADDGANNWVNRREAVTAMVADQKPAVMGVQEARIDQKNYMDMYLTGYKSVGVGRNNGNNAEYPAIYYLENAVELEKWGNFWLSETPDEISVGWDASVQRNLTWAVLSIRNSDKKFFCMNTHLDHIGPTARAESMKLIEARMKSLNTENLPVLLTGDFNTTLSSSIFSGISAFMADARMTSPETDNKDSYNGFGESGMKIDHIFYTTAGFIPVRFSTIDKNYGVPYISDHYPVVANLKFK